jgi:hypothetical protein
MHLARCSRASFLGEKQVTGRQEMRDWMAFATAIVLALLTKMLLP